MADKQKKSKKKKVIYIDDGSTIADMSGVSRGGKSSQKKEKNSSAYRAPFKQQLKTFTDAQKAMLLPMLAVLGLLALAFLIVYILL